MQGGHAGLRRRGVRAEKTFTYTGTAEADGRAATLTLTFTGTVVSGKLVAEPVCSGSVRLTRTEIFIRSAVLSGTSWETPASTIQGSWDGADYDCNGVKMAGYPEAGDVTISVSGNSVFLQRIAGAGKYVFPAQGNIYTPAPCTTTSGACSIRDAGPNPISQYDTLTITGTGFGSADGGQVLFDTTPGGWVSSWTDTQIQIAVPGVTPGNVGLTVKTGGKSCTLNDSLGAPAKLLQVQAGGCVAAGTKVSLADGSTRPIEKVLPGDTVFALDPETKTVRTAVVKRLLTHSEQPFTLNTLRLSKGQVLEVTGNHPVLTQSRKWVSVDDLRPGDVVFTIDARTHKTVKAKIASIVRDESKADVVYNLQTTAENYFANELLIHNKCLQAGSLIDTPAGQVPVESVRPGQLIYGEVSGVRVVTPVTHAYAKSTELGAIPGKRLTPHVAATINHLVQVGGRFVSAGELPAPDEAIPGTVYDLQTEAGNYFADGLEMKP